MNLKKYTWKTTATSLRGQWVNRISRVPCPIGYGKMKAFWVIVSTIIPGLNPVRSIEVPYRGPLTRHVKLWVQCACAGNPGNISPPQLWHTCRGAPGSLNSDFLWSRWRGNVPGIPGASASRSFTYLVRGTLTVRLMESNIVSRDEVILFEMVHPIADIESRYFFVSEWCLIY